MVYKDEALDPDSRRPVIAAPQKFFSGFPYPKGVL